MNQFFKRFGLNIPKKQSQEQIQEELRIGQEIEKKIAELGKIYPNLLENDSYILSDEAERSVAGIQVNYEKLKEAEQKVIDQNEKKRLVEIYSKNPTDEAKKIIKLVRDNWQSMTNQQIIEAYTKVREANHNIPFPDEIFFSR